MGCGIQHWRQLHTYTHEELVRVQIAYDDELEVESSESLFATEISRSGSPTDDLNWPKWWQLLAFVHLSWCPITFWKLNLLDSIFLFLLLQECACQGWIQSTDTPPHTGIDWHPIHNRLSYTPVTHPKTSSACPNFWWFAKHGWRTTFHTNWLPVAETLSIEIHNKEKLQTKWQQGMKIRC